MEELRGGLARNVIADQCTVDWELRPVVIEDGIFVNHTMDDYAKNVLLTTNEENLFLNLILKKKLLEMLTRV